MNPSTLDDLDDAIAQLEDLGDPLDDMGERHTVEAVIATLISLRDRVAMHIANQEDEDNLHAEELEDLEDEEDDEDDPDSPESDPA
jgi:hypothetical protein